MAKILILHQKGSNRNIAVSSSLQVGRLNPDHRHSWAVPEREQPPEFAGLEAFLYLSGDGQISRNHLGIARDNEDYYVLDLNSLNGTYLNGVNINPEKRNPQPKLLHQGDTIRLPGAVDLEVKLTEFMNYALLIAADSDNPLAAQNDAEQLAQELIQRKYAVHLLEGTNATKQAVRDKLDEISCLTVPESKFFLYFHGHGSCDGLKLGEQTLNPRELYKKLKNIRAPTAVVLEACHAGIFVEEENKDKIPEGVLVLTASNSDNFARESNSQPANYGGRFTRALISYIKEHQEQFNLKDFYRSLSEENRNQAKVLLQEPVMEGQTYLMPRVTSVLRF